MPDFRTLVLALKPGIAVAGAVLLLADAYGYFQTPYRRRLRDWTLAAFGALAFAGWWNFGAFHFGGRYLHPHEFFHYYLGSKYANELGYTRLYECAALVEVEQGRGREVANRWMRDLETNAIVRGSRALGNPRGCTAHFDRERWADFSQDVLFFRDLLGPDRWTSVFIDHGFNATPVWTGVGRLLAGSGPVTLGRLRGLALIDPLLLIILWATVWWGFGWRVMWVALLWWGTNIPAGFAFTGGGFLRQDFLLLLVAAPVLARRGYPVVAGFAIGWASLLRLFPALLVAGVLCSLAFDVMRGRWPGDRSMTKVLLGALLSVAALVPLTAATLGPPFAPIERWTAFAANTRKHLGQPSPNRAGLRTLVAFSPDTRLAVVNDVPTNPPGTAWTTAREQVWRERRIVFVLLAVPLLVLIAHAMRGRPPWAALVLGAALVPILLDVSVYYYGFLLVLAFLWPEIPAAGVALAAGSALTGAAAALWSTHDDRATATSLAIVAIVVAIAVGALIQRGRSGTPTEPA